MGCAAILLVAACAAASASAGEGARSIDRATIARSAPPSRSAIEAAPAARPSTQRGKRKKKQKVQPIVPFAGELSEARKDARERNVPILILMALEGEEASDRFRDGVLPDLNLAKACERSVVLFTNNGLHEVVEVTEVVDGETTTRMACEYYKTPSCTIHQRVWDQVFFEFNADGEIRLPHVLVLNPDGSIFRRISTRDVPSISTIIEAFEDAQKEAGPGLTPSELRTLRGALLPARKNTELKLWAAAWRQWQIVSSIVSTGPYAEEAGRGIRAAQSGLREELDYALSKLIPGQAARGYELLLELRKEVEGLPFADTVDETLRDAAKNKELKEEIRAFKLELEARKQLDEAYALIARKDMRKAERVVRKLLKSKRLAGTQAVATAREEFPEWAAPK